MRGSSHLRTDLPDLYTCCAQYEGSHNPCGKFRVCTSALTVLSGTYQSLWWVPSSKHLLCPLWGIPTATLLSSKVCTPTVIILRGSHSPCWIKTMKYPHGGQKVWLEELTGVPKRQRKPVGSIYNWNITFRWTITHVGWTWRIGVLFQSHLLCNYMML